MAQKIPKSNTSDMTIDELSEAIDAHMENVTSTPTKPKEEQPTMDEKVEAAIKKVAKTEIPTAKPDIKSSKIKVKKSGYITKVEEKPKTDAPAREPDGRIATSNRDIKPVKRAVSSKKSPEQASPPTSVKTPEPTKVKMVDVVVKTTKTSTPKPLIVEPKSEKSPISITKDPPEPVTEQKPPAQRIEKPVSIKEEFPKVRATEPVKEETVADTKPKNEAAKLPQSSNVADELSAQIVEKKKPEEKPAKGDTLKTFDTKQYHIPIKPSSHHRAGSSFMVFAAVLAAILATVFVLNELEIIDLAALFYSN